VYEKAWLRSDVVAGLVTAAVVVPKAMAYATIAGLPVEVGLYTAIVPMVIYAVLGTSRVLSVSTTTTIAILVAADLGAAVPNGDQATLMRATVTLGLLVGAMLLVAALLRLGFVADFISEPVLIGFKSGIGLVIVLDQIPKLLGFHIAKGNFLENVPFPVLHDIPGVLDGYELMRRGHDVVVLVVELLDVNQHDDQGTRSVRGVGDRADVIFRVRVDADRAGFGVPIEALQQGGVATLQLALEPRLRSVVGLHV